MGFEGFQDGRRAAESQRVRDFQRMTRLLETADEARDRRAAAALRSRKYRRNKREKAVISQHKRMVTDAETCPFPSCETAASHELSWRELDESYILPDKLPVEDEEAWHLGLLQPKIEIEEDLAVLNEEPVFIFAKSSFKT